MALLSFPAAYVRVKRARLQLCLAATAALAGCTTFSPDGGMLTVAAITRKEIQKDALAIRSESDAVTARRSVEALLKRPLSADFAAQIALLNNRGLQAAYNQLFAAEASAVEASLPPNPTIKLSRLSSQPETEIARQIAVDLIALATLPARTAIAQERFRQAVFRAAEETLRVAVETKRAYYRAVATQQSVGLLAQAQTAALAASRLAERLGQTGAINKLDQAREQVFYAELSGQLAIARQRARSERERLTRLMGLWGADLDFMLSGALPPLPRQPAVLPLVERDAVLRRVDLHSARHELAALAKSLGLTRATRYISILEISGVWETTREPDRRFTKSGVEIEFSIPIFDVGEARMRQAEQTYLQALNRLAERAVNVRSEARDAYRTYRSTYDIARHYRNEVLPLRKVISDEMLLRYNAMQVDVFELLTEARQRINAHVTGIEAQRDFWLAETDLTAAIAGGGNASPADAGSTMTAQPSGAQAH